MIDSDEDPCKARVNVVTAEERAYTVDKPNQNIGYIKSINRKIRRKVSSKDDMINPIGSLMRLPSPINSAKVARTHAREVKENSGSPFL